MSAAAAFRLQSGREAAAAAVMNHALIDSFSAQHILDEEVQLEPSSFAAPRTHFAESTFKQSVVYPGIPKHGFMGEGGTERRNDLINSGPE